MAQGSAGGAIAAGRGRGRVLEVDALRGFALGGIFVVNVLAMAGPYGETGDPGAGGLDRTAEWLVVALAQTKFYLLFSFLFGYSFALQMTSAERAGARFRPRMIRRLCGLCALGLLHAVFLYVGDILIAYSLLGLFLLLAAKTPAEKAWRIARRIAGVTAVLFVLIAAAALTGPPDSAAQLRAEAAHSTAAYGGAPADVIMANLKALPELITGVLLLGGFVVAAFLAGLAAGKRQLLARAGERRERLWRGVVIGAAVGVPGALFMACGVIGPLPARWEATAYMAGMALAPALSVAYACAFLLWITRPGRGAAVAARLAPAGRMSLTNYLSQSLVMALVFTGYGLGLYGRTGAAVAVCGALVVYAGQLALSARLLRRYRMGPVEWLLRWVTLAGRPGRSPLDSVDDRRVTSV
ncbi:DUF418 domain-containing protein [Streptomyces monticola]|uniref:DUF418 domain-containing protein n=1 Tax=Streptomyces monticola TaxID=2666263 RepID=A0ABW2JH71_9ACTN